MQYEVRILSARQEIEHLLIEASDEADVRRQLQSRNVHIANIKAKQHQQSLTHFLPTKNRTTRHMNLLLFSQELLALLKAGLSIVEALEALQENEVQPVMRDILTRLLIGLTEGKRFSKVLAEQSDLFPTLYVSIIQGAEGTSNLPRALARYIAYEVRLQLIRSKVTSAMIYPAILLGVGVLVTFFLIGYVVPQFADVYRGSGKELPFLSQVLLNWGQFIKQDPGRVAGIVAILTVGLSILARHAYRTGQFQRLLRRLPGVRNRIKIYELSRLYLTLGMLLEGGIAIINALETVQSLASTDMRADLAKAIRAIQNGVQVSTAFASCALITPISLRMLRVGEHSGDLGFMLAESAAFYDAEINRWVDTFIRAFEPLLMALIGLIVGTIVTLLYMPIFDLAGSFS